MSAVNLNAIVCGVLLRPPTFRKGRTPIYKLQKTTPGVKTDTSYGNIPKINEKDLNAIESNQTMISVNHTHDHSLENKNIRTSNCIKLSNTPISDIHGSMHLFERNISIETHYEEQSRYSHIVSFQRIINCTKRLSIALTPYLSTDNPALKLYYIAAFLQHFAQQTPYTFLPLRANMIGIDKNAASLLISIIGLCSGTCRILFGYIADRKPENRLWMFACANMVVGLVTAGSILVQSFPLLVVYSALYGSIGGNMFVLSSIS